MKNFARALRRATCTAIVLLAATSAVFGAAPRDPYAANADVLARQLRENGQLPPAPAHVTELRFQDLYRLPAGPAGLEFSDLVRRLDGQRVRVLGFMVRQQRASAGVMLLAPFPLVTSENEYGLCDDLPANVIFVAVPKYADIAVPFTPGPLLLTGTLTLGAREEPDGRVSHLRLVLDPEQVAWPAASASSFSSE